jgi:hypothetical protein
MHRTKSLEMFQPVEMCAVCLDLELALFALSAASAVAVEVCMETLGSVEPPLRNSRLSRAAYPSSFILLDSITLSVFSKEYKL